MQEKLGNPKNTIEIIQKYEFAFQKKFGQNFLIDTTVLDRIISSAEITKEDCVLEIGPGIGTMTQYLAEAAREVVAVEIDNNLIPILRETLKNYEITYYRPDENKEPVTCSNPNITDSTYVRWTDNYGNTIRFCS